MAEITHAVITSGTQINSPVMKYFFTTVGSIGWSALYLAGEVVLVVLAEAAGLLAAAAAPVGAGGLCMPWTPLRGVATPLAPELGAAGVELDGDSEVDSDFVSPLASALAAAALALPPPLKSVAYQPVPLS